jgi:uncharacterized protein (TIRG00374 family)
MDDRKPQNTSNPFQARHIIRYLFPVIVLGLAVHLILPQFTSLERSYQVIQGLLWWALALALVSQAASYLSNGYLLLSLVKLSGSTLSILAGTMITLAGASLGMVAGGVVGSSAAYYHWMQKRNVNLEGATLAGTLPGILVDLVLAAVSLVGLIHLLIVHQLSRLQGISYASVLFVLAGIIGLLLWGLKKRSGLIKLVNRIGHRWADFRHKNYHEERTHRFLTNLFQAADLLVSGGWRGPLVGAVLNIAFDMLTIYFIFLAVGHRVPFGVLLTGYGLPLLLGKMAFVVPGGIGVIESTMTALYTSLGVANSEAVIVVLVYRLISFWLPLILGFPMILILQRKDKEG